MPFLFDARLWQGASQSRKCMPGPDTECWGSKEGEPGHVMMPLASAPSLHLFVRKLSRPATVHGTLKVEEGLTNEKSWSGILDFSETVPSPGPGSNYNSLPDLGFIVAGHAAGLICRRKWLFL